MNTKKKVHRILSRNLLMSSIVWAAIILGCSLIRENGNNNITYILISGYFIEFLRITSANKSIKKELEIEQND